MRLKCFFCSIKVALPAVLLFALLILSLSCTAELDNPNDALNDTNAYLDTITFSSGTLSPDFDEKISAYTLTVGSAIESITVSPLAERTYATVTVNGDNVAPGSASGDISLAYGSGNTVTIIVTSPDASASTTYNITVYRAFNTDLSSLALSDGYLYPSFSGGNYSYFGGIPGTSGTITVTPTVALAGSTVTVNGVPVTSGSASGDITLDYGSNNITIVVTSEDSTSSMTYTLEAFRALRLARTGQDTCLDADGNTIACNGTGQDGDYLAGVAWPEPRFTDNLDGTITDNLTGLMWVQDMNLARTLNYNPDSGGAGDVWWDSALEFVAGMNGTTYTNYGYTDWRLPNVLELLTIWNSDLDASAATWLYDSGFTTAYAEDYYWTSTSNPNSFDRTVIYDLYAGGCLDIIHTHKEFSTYQLWAVRDDTGVTAQVVLPRTGQDTCYSNSGDAINCTGTGQDGDLRKGTDWPLPRFVDRGNGTVTDNLTGLTWEKRPGGGSDGTGTASELEWTDAVSYCEGLELGGDTDWRTPNVLELLSLIHWDQADSSVWLNGQGFDSVQDDVYWSSTRKDTSAFYMEFYDSTVYDDSISSSNYAWAVRGGL